MDEDNIFTDSDVKTLESEPVIDPDNLDPVEEDTTEPDPSSGETNAEADTSDEEPSEGTDTEGEEQSTDETEADDTETQGPKNKFENRVRDLNAQMNHYKTQYEQLIAEKYELPSVEDKVADGTDPVLARLEVLEQERQVEAFTQKVTQVRMAQESEAERVLSEFQYFDKQAEGKYNPEIQAIAEDLYLAVEGAQVHPETGLTYQVNATPYPVFASVAKAYEAGLKAGRVSGQKSNDKMLAAAETPSSTAPKQPKKDAFEAAMDAEFDKF